MRANGGTSLQDVLSEILEGLGPARKFADPSSPPPVRTMAAGGALPLPPPQIAAVLFVLSHDEDDTVRERAQQTLADLPERIAIPALEAQLHPALLADFAQRYSDHAAHLERIALNPCTSDATFCILATRPFGRLIDIVAANQTRLLRCPELLEALSENPVTSPATLDRVLEFLGIPVSDTSSTSDSIPEPPPPAEGTESADAVAYDPDDPKDLPEDLIAESDETSDEEGEDDELKSASMHAAIQDMNVMQKIKLARFGNGEARSILVRDRNKLVAAAAINSPKLTETEVISFAKSKAVSEDILRTIGSSREWTKSRAVKHALVTNPKTPLPIAMKFIGHLTDGDLKLIMKSKDVAAQISTHARRMLMKKGKV